MTNERAVEILNLDLDILGQYGGESAEAYKMAIKALEQQPTDAVSRSELQKTMDSLPLFRFVNNDHEEVDDYYNCESVDMVIRNLPPVIPQRKKGRWINKFGKEQGYDIAGIKTWYIQIMCDKCGFIKTAIEGHTGQYKYCPNCGAEMGGADETN